jgi:hypothetical protein
MVLGQCSSGLLRPVKLLPITWLHYYDEIALASLEVIVVLSTLSCEAGGWPMGSCRPRDWHLHAVTTSITEARRKGRLDLGDVLNALCRVRTGSYDYPNEDHARQLAEGLRNVLTVEELRGLCSEAERQLTGEVRSTVWRLEEAVKRSTESLQQQGQPIPRFAEMSLKNDDCQSSPLVAMAVILQALAWVIRPPAERPPAIIA